MKTLGDVLGYLGDYVGRWIQVCLVITALHAEITTVAQGSLLAEMGSYSTLSVLEKLASCQRWFC